jgi:hypothetical protein
MTAISMMYTGGSFLIAADGRCRSDDESATKERETDQAQKIFPVETENMKLAYALTGFSSTEDGRFDLVAESEKQVQTLAMSRCSNGYEYVHRFCLNIKRAVTKARRDGQITEFSKNEHLPPEEKGRQFKFFFLGYFRGLPFWTEAKFYHDEETDRIQIRKADFELVPTIHSVGSEVLANMMYYEAAIVDPRLANYKKGPNDGVLEYITSYIKACSDPIALEIDPVCNTIGGHIHAAEVTRNGLKWLLEPKPQRLSIRES